MKMKVVYAGEHDMRPDIWEIHAQGEDGHKRLMLIPKVALNWRSAEYGIDPEDVDALLDILLHEGQVPPKEEEEQSQRLPRLLETTNTSDALKFQKQRIRRVPRQFDFSDSEALNTIRENHTPDRNLIRAMSEEIDVARWVANYGGLPDIVETSRRSVVAIPFDKMED